ncbi:hypothetical protein RAS2_05040 [Phycisphaerae bacterium RAS2]|nr:hypothetical protein RAS2_05040 [Phycisphaerae bacterium RAS2]
MSTQSDILPPPPSSLLRRLQFTPLSDLLRGRVSARLDVEQLIHRAGIAPELAALVRCVTKRSRLWKSEQVEVAEELIAHLCDSLDRGVSPADVLSHFGDPVIAARLIRRAKRRNRSLPIRATTWAIRGTGCLLLACMATYLFWAVRLYTGSVEIRRNYVAEYNAPILAMSDDEKAWPIYKQAALATGEPPAGLTGSSIHPRHDQWAKWTEYASANEEAIRLYRLAAAKPHIGRTYSNAKDADILQHWKAQAEYKVWYPAEPQTTPCENPVLFQLDFSELSVLRSGARLLKIDAYLALQRRDSDRLSADLHALLAMADHAAERPMVYSGLVAITIMTQCAEVVDHVLESDSLALSDEFLKKFSHRLAVCIHQGRLRVPFQHEWDSIEDVIQRTFSDDGRGDGRLVNTAFLDVVAGGPTLDLTPKASTVLAPIVSGMAVDRRILMNKLDELKSMTEAEEVAPLWERKSSEAEQSVVRMHASGLEKMRYAPLSILFPAMSRVGYLYEIATLRRDATLTAIAIELFHRRTGSYPAGLRDLTPAFLPAVPLDRYDGRALKYRLINGRPLLYSVGADRDDDGGRLPKDSKKGRANIDAREWIPLEVVHTGSPSAGWRIPDGDWILWPPVDDEPR